MAEKEIAREIRLAELRAAPNEEEPEKMTVEGYAVIFDSPATWGDYTEIIDRNAFNGCDMRDVPMRFNHSDEYMILARTRNKSLQMAVDDVGLFIRAELIDTQANEDVYKSIQSGLLDKMSFAFTCSKDEWDYESNTRRVLSIDKLFDVSVVDTPFYDQTSIYARALSQLESGKAELESRKRAALDLRKAKARAKITLRKMRSESWVKKHTSA